MKHLIITMMIFQSILPFQAVFAETTVLNVPTMIKIESTENLDAAYDSNQETTVSFIEESTITFSNLSETKKSIRLIQDSENPTIYSILIEEIDEEAAVAPTVVDEEVKEIKLAPLSAHLINEEVVLDEEGNEVVETIFTKGEEWTEEFVLDLKDAQFTEMHEIKISSIEEIIEPATEEAPITEAPVNEEPVVEPAPAEETQTTEEVVIEPAPQKTQTFRMASVQTMATASSIDTYNYLNGVFEMYPMIVTTPTTAAPLNLANLKDNNLTTFTTLTTSYNSFFTDLEKPIEIEGMYINSNASADMNIRIRALADGAYVTIATVSTNGYIDLSQSAIKGKKVSRFTVDRITSPVQNVVGNIQINEMEFFKTGAWDFPAKNEELQSVFKPLVSLDRSIAIEDANFKACLNTKIGQAAAADIKKSQIDALSGVLDCSNRGILTLNGTDGFQTKIRDIVVSYGNEGTLDNATYFLLTEDGLVYAWGYNVSGQVGNGTRTAVASPTLISFGGKKIRKIAANGSATLAIDDSFKIWSWGEGNQGGLGHGDQTDQLVPKRIASITGNVIDIASFGSNVSGPAATSYAIVEDGTTGFGTLWAWGYDIAGQVGVGNDSLDFYTSPQLVKKANGNTMTEIATVSAGGSFASAIDKWGRVWVWGSGADGKLARGVYGDTDVKTAIEIDALPPSKKVSLGNKSAHVLTKDGAVYAWGHNVLGQLGDGTTGGKSLPVLVGLSNVKDIRAGIYTTMALTNDGNAYAWGYNAHNQIDSSTTSPISVPQLKSANATHIFIGARNTGFVKADQTIQIAGNNLDGQMLDAKRNVSSNYAHDGFRGLMRFLGANITSIDLSGNTGINLDGTKGMAKLTTVKLNNTGLSNFTSLNFTNVKNLEVKTNNISDTNGFASLTYLENVDLSNNLLTAADSLSVIPNAPVVIADNNFIDSGAAASYTDVNNKQYNFVLETKETTETSATYSMRWVHQGSEINAKTVIDPIVGEPVATSLNGNNVVKSWNAATNRYEFTVNKAVDGQDTITIAMANTYAKTTDLEFTLFQFIVEPFAESVSLQLSSDLAKSRKTIQIPGFEVVDSTESKNWSVGITAKAVNTTQPVGAGFEAVDTFVVDIDTNSAVMNGVGSAPKGQGFASSIHAQMNTVLFNADGSPKAFQVIYTYEITVAE